VVIFNTDPHNTLIDMPTTRPDLGHTLHTSFNTTVRLVVAHYLGAFQHPHNMTEQWHAWTGLEWKEKSRSIVVWLSRDPPPPAHRLSHLIRSLKSDATKIWSTAVRCLHPDTLNFALNAAVDTLPHMPTYIFGKRKTLTYVPTMQLIH